MSAGCKAVCVCVRVRSCAEAENGDAPMPSNTYTAMPKNTGSVPTSTRVRVWWLNVMSQWVPDSVSVHREGGGEGVVAQGDVAVGT